MQTENKVVSLVVPEKQLTETAEIRRIVKSIRQETGKEVNFLLVRALWRDFSRLKDQKGLNNHATADGLLTGINCRCEVTKEQADLCQNIIYNYIVPAWTYFGKET